MALNAFTLHFWYFAEEVVRLANVGQRRRRENEIQSGQKFAFALKCLEINLNG